MRVRVLERLQLFDSILFKKEKTKMGIKILTACWKKKFKYIGYSQPFVLSRHQCWHFVTQEFIAANGCTVVVVGWLLSVQLSMR